MAKKAATIEKPLEVPGMTPDEIFAATTEDELHTKKLVKIAQQQLQTSVKYKQPRMEDVQKILDLYDLKTKKALKGRWNVPLPIMSGYVDTLLSKIDDAPKIKFSYQDIADMRRAAKVQAKWDQDAGSVGGRWAEKDRLAKKIAAIYGVAILKYFAFNDAEGKYQSHLEVVDPLDFECEPMGGQDLSKHEYKGQRNIFKTRSQLIKGATGKNPIYSRKAILQLIHVTGSEEYKNFEKLWVEKTERLKSLGFSPDQHSYMGVSTYNLTEWYMRDPESGQNWYLLFEPHSGIAVRSCPQEDVFESDTDPFDAWHTHPDAFNFWSKSPADDMKPIAEGMGVIFNQMLDAREKNTYSMRAVDPDVFPDISQLEWRPDGIAETRAGASSEQALSNAILEFKVEGMSESGTINLLEFMDQVAGLKTGVTASAQGETSDKTNGIYFGNLQQVADRLGIFNKAYSECWGRLGLKYYWGLREHIKNNKLMVKMIGSKGYNWVELVAEDTDPKQEFNIEVVGGQAQQQMDAIAKKTRADALLAITQNPTLVARMNPDVLIEETLRNGQWEEAQIKRLMDLQSYNSEEIVSEAMEAVQDILEGKTPKENRGATTLFIQTITDFAYDAEDLDEQQFQAMVDFAEKHIPIATQNMMRNVRMQTAAMNALPEAGAGKGAPAPDAMGGQGGGNNIIPQVGEDATKAVPGAPMAPSPIAAG